MAQENRFDPARLERIERRLPVLEDAEAIRNLKARYAALCDNEYDADGIASEPIGSLASTVIELPSVRVSVMLNDPFARPWCASR